MSEKRFIPQEIHEFEKVKIGIIEIIGAYGIDVFGNTFSLVIVNKEYKKVNYHGNYKGDIDVAKKNAMERVERCVSDSLKQSTQVRTGLVVKRRPSHVAERFQNVMGWADSVFIDRLTEFIVSSGEDMVWAVYKHKV